MIEHPEAITIARQIADSLSGKRIASAVRGNAPHKFAFYSRPAEEYAAILEGKAIGGAEASGSLILVNVGRKHLLVLGGGGERILYHAPDEEVPKRHQLLLSFDDRCSLSVRVQGWGSCQLWTPDELAAYRWYARRSLSPTEDGFTLGYVNGLFAALEPDDPRSIKCFLISEPGVWGLGNGYLQDVLFQARLHPRTRAVDVTATQHRSLFKAISRTFERAIALRGRTDERDLFGQRGGYERTLSSATVGRDCPRCARSSIVKESYLGGSIYFCPTCQEPPSRPTRARRRAD